MQTILVTDELEYWGFLADHTTIISAYDYLTNNDYFSQSVRVINLSSSYDHQTIGYYVSLLAQARGHKVIPSALTIQDCLNTSLSKHISQSIKDEIQTSLRHIKTEKFVLSLYFGKNISPSYQNLAKKLYALFPLPLIRFTLEKKKLWSIKKLEFITLQSVPEHHQLFMQESAITFFSKKRFQQSRKKTWLHDLAILIDPEEPHPPSDKKAIEQFIQAGNSQGLHVELVDKNQIKSVAEYDALFIRATTAVNHYTYLFSRRASQEGLIVIDDPQSIVKCTNKVYLAELMKKNQILTPDTSFISQQHSNYDDIQFPCVLKRPDSAFSQGVIKVADVASLKRSLNKFFKTSDLILLQAYIPTPFDWRIGVIDNKPLYACKYYMAKDHWQIYNWKAKGSAEGAYETIPLPQVPEAIIKTALKAASLIGNGLYGVDIKTDGEKHYVIEINDNPSIETEVEDAISGVDLYQQIMSVFIQRIRKKHGYA